MQNFVFLVFISSVFARDPCGTIAGTVQDASEAPIPGVTCAACVDGALASGRQC